MLLPVKETVPPVGGCTVWFGATKIVSDPTTVEVPAAFVALANALYLYPRLLEGKL